MLIRKKLSKKEALKYCEISGLQPTTEVYIQTYDDETQKKIDKIISQLYLGDNI